jgi:DNA polymerase III subunit gamma/tau
MENYIVSARKYRPETFENVIGQPSITTTLRNAIRVRQLAHAYLFCGPRGIGKTTCARIFAKTINCFNITGAVEACNECESCRSFNTSRSYNIHELDAASNNSVEDIRTLIDQVRIPPQVGKYSVYIIDEVHMLSSNAFNAFLKTLEEPPSHAIFILATTEKHKIIPTILSRCQIFDFNRIKIEDIVAHLETIASAENIETESEGLNIIAQKADGAMRDALSIFDLIASFSSGKISYKNVIDNLNVLDYDYYFRVTESILGGDISSALLIFDEVLDKGFDGHNFINGLSSHFRDLLVCRDEATLGLLEAGETTRKRYRAQSKSCSPELLINSLALTNQCDLSFRASKNQRLHVELCLVQLCGQMTAEKKNSEPGSDRSVTETAARVPEEPLQVPRGPVKQQGKSIQQEARKQEAEPPDNYPEKPLQVAGIQEKQPGIQDRQEDPPHFPAGKSETTEQQEAAENKSDEPAAVPGPPPPGQNGNNAGTALYTPNTGNTFSIKNALRGIAPKQDENLEETVESGNDDESPPLSEEGGEFTEKELTEQWRKFANRIRDNQPRLYSHQSPPGRGPEQNQTRVVKPSETGAEHQPGTGNMHQ